MAKLRVYQSSYWVVSLSAPVREMCVKSWPSAAPCQCFSPAGMNAVSPSEMPISSDSLATIPSPLVTNSIWSDVWEWNLFFAPS